MVGGIPVYSTVMLKFVYTALDGKDRFIRAASIEEAREQLRKSKVEFTKLQRTFWGKRTYRGGTSVFNAI